MNRPPGEFEPRELTGLFAPPGWLRDLGMSAWLAVGVTLFIAGVIAVLALTDTIVMPVITAAVIAAVASPLVARFKRRGLGAALVLVGLIVLSIAVAGVVLGGISSQVDELRAELSAAKETLADWANDAGIERDTSETAKEDISAALSDSVPALLEGVGGGLKKLSSLAFFLSLTALSLFFLLKDGPLIRRWAEGLMRVPRPMAHGIFQRVLESFRGYFFGVTLVAGFNAVVVGLGAFLLGVPLAGTIAAITFVGAYVPYLGAWGAGAFSVLIALGGAGEEAAAGMIVIQLLANGILQQMIQPIAYGAALGIHPLAVLVVTIGGGALFGAVGLILAAPLTSAITKIAGDLSGERASPAPAEPEAGAAPAT